MNKIIALLASSAVITGLALPTTVLADGDDLESQISSLSKQISKLEKQVKQLKKSKKTENFVDSDDDKGFNTSAVTTTPTLGLRSAHHGMDLIVNFSTLNEDVRMLDQRALYQKQRGVEELSRPLVQLSGVLRGVAGYKNSFYDVSSTYLDLNSAEIDAFIEASRWVSGLMSLTYDNGLPGYELTAADAASPYTKTGWSNIYLKRGFITVGDFTSSPWYASIGQMFVPFGKFSTFLVSNPLTKSLAKTSGRAIDVGYKGKDFVATAFAMKGDTYTSDNTKNINSWGGNVQYSKDLGDDKNAVLGAGYIHNLADSEGISSIVSYIASHSYELDNYMPAIDLYGKFSFANWIVNAEYVKALDSLSIAGTNIGQPSAAHFELDHTMFVGKLPLALGMGYGHSKNFENYMPEDSYSIAASTYLFKDTVQSLEFRHLRAKSAVAEAYLDAAGIQKNYLTFVFSMYF